LKFESKTNEARLEDQKPRKAPEGHLEEEKTTKLANGTKSGKPRKMAKKSEPSTIRPRLAKTRVNPHKETTKR
jgi:hypothetical protein